MTNVGRSGTSRLWLGETIIPSHCGIGSGSGISLITQTALVQETGTRAGISTTDSGTTQFLEHTFDFSSLAISGTTQLKEFGLFTAITTGDMWIREDFNGITFDGSNELQVVIKLEVF